MVTYNVKSVIITTAVPSSPPQNVTVASVDPASLMVTWQPPPLIDQNGPLTEYAITYQRIGYLDVMNVSVNVTHFKISGLSPFVNYSVSVAAINMAVAGNSIMTMFYIINMAEAVPNGKFKF